jgi:polar amino acid transport system permease protein
MGSGGFLSELVISRNDLFYGFYITVLVSLISIVVGTILGVLVGVVLTYGNLPARFLARFYTDVIRGIPSLVLILTFFYVLSVVGINLNALQAGIYSLCIFCSAHVAEMLRGGLQNVHVGQTEAAKALGFSFRQTFTFILMPQALRQVLPTWINTAIETLKGSSLVSIIGVQELILSTQQIIARNFLTLQFYALAGLLYFIACFSIESFGKYLEKKVAIK